MHRLDDIAMDEVRLTTPVSEEAMGRLKLGDIVYLDGALFTAREGVYRKVVDEGHELPPAVRALTNVNFHCSPAASRRADGRYAVEAVTATASFRFGKSFVRWFERSGTKVIVGKAGLTETAYREWFVPHGAGTSPPWVTAWGRPTGGPSSVWSTCTGWRSSGSRRPSGSWKWSGSVPSWSRATATDGAS